ncbi:hypothetical protein [Neisseria meningitidis]|uniref:hypothetical protein n=1 Tax=Neisseria meningitidis TaxID=487 RepID=UPI001EE1133F|nr:hypothetical protein [Neisseria meningitidis]
MRFSFLKAKICADMLAKSSHTGTYENYEKLLASGVKMPFKAEIDFDFVTNGKAVKQIVTNVVPVFEKPKNS